MVTMIVPTVDLDSLGVLCSFLLTRKNDVKSHLDPYVEIARE